MQNKVVVLLDTSFFLRFLNDEDPLYNNAQGYYDYFISNQIYLGISTISIAEYCVKGSIEELPMRNLQIYPFNISHAIEAGKFANILLEARQKSDSQFKHNRRVILNDIKIFAQAHYEKNISYYLTSDTESEKYYNHLKSKTKIDFEFVNLNNSYQQSFNLLL